MNNNRTDEAAILSRGKGVFSKTSYITVGTKEYNTQSTSHPRRDFLRLASQPELYGQREADRSNYKGKQFAAIPPKSGKVPNSYFTPKHEWIADGDVFVDRTRYAEVQKEKAKGFLTGDFRRRDEFSNTIRTKQWREQLQQEQKFAKASLETVEVPAEAHTTSAVPQDDFLYDRVFEKSEDRSRETSRLPKERDLGAMRTTYALMHPPPTSFEKPAFARKPIIRDTFYRKMNIPFAQN